LPPDLQEKAWIEALDAVRAIGEDIYRGRSFLALAESLPPELLPKALQAAREIIDELTRSEALSAIAISLPVEQQINVMLEALRIARKWSPPRWVVVVRKKPPSSALEELIDIFSEIEDLAFIRANVMVALSKSGFMSASGALNFVMDLLNNDRDFILVTLLPYLSLENLYKALPRVVDITDPYVRFHALSTLASRLPPEQELEFWKKALQIAREIEWESHRIRALSAIAMHLPSEQQRETVAEIMLTVAKWKIGDELERIKILSVLAEQLPLDQQAQFKAEILQVLQTVKPQSDYIIYARLLWTIAGILPIELLSEAFHAIRKVTSPGEDRAEPLAALAPHLPSNLLAEALRLALETGRPLLSGEEWYDTRDKALASLAPYLPPRLLSKALHEIRKIRNEATRARALLALAPHLPPKQQSLAIAEAMRFARRIKYEEERVQVLAVLAPYLPLELLAETLHTIALEGRIRREGERVRALANLAPYLPPELLSKALHIAQSMEVKWARVEALSAIAPFLPLEQKHQALAEALAAAREIEDAYTRAHALTALAAHFPEVLPEALAVAKGIGSEWDRAKALTALAPRLAELPRPVLYPPWDETLPRLARRTRPDLLTDLRALVPVIHALGGEAAIAETFRAIQDVARWWP
jgi:hypothetical protein